jgi:hypothetical protein
LYCLFLTVGIDVTREVKPIVDPRRYIKLSGSSNISSVPIKQEPVELGRNKSIITTEKRDDEDVALDDDFGFDPAVWETLADTSVKPTTRASQKATCSKENGGKTSKEKADAAADDKKQLPKRRKKDSDEL